jgi:hypothetical protein
LRRKSAEIGLSFNGGFQMLFSNSSAVQLEGVEERKDLLKSIFLDFNQAFSDIEFELDERSRTVNAQAIMHGDARLVRLYGGLGFHPLIGEDGVVFVLLHEVGHHLAAGGRLAFCQDLGCECAADRWALTRGRATLKKRTGRIFSIDNVLASLEALSESTRNNVVQEKTYEGPSPCWAFDWRRRRLHLAGLRKLPALRRCYMSDYFLSHS